MDASIWLWTGVIVFILGMLAIDLLGQDWGGLIGLRLVAEHPDLDATIHMAARIVVPESVEQPYEYYRDNVAKSLELFDGMMGLDVHRASRVASTAHGQQIVVSAPVRELVEGHLSEAGWQVSGVHLRSSSSSVTPELLQAPRLPLNELAGGCDILLIAVPDDPVMGQGTAVDRSNVSKIDFTRILVLGESLSLGFRALSWSAQKAAGEEEEPLTRWEIGSTMAIALVVIAISLLILGYELGQFRVIGTVALWGVMLFALASGVDYFAKFSRAIRAHKMFELSPLVTAATASARSMPAAARYSRTSSSVVCAKFRYHNPTV